MSSPTPRPAQLRLATLTVVLAGVLAACSPWHDPAGSPGQGTMDGMPMGDAPMGTMHERDPDDPPQDQAPTPVEGAPQLEVRATEMAFSPGELTLEAGEPVTVTVTNDGDIFHDFHLDIAEVHLNIDPGEQATAAITIDDPGTYEAICTVPGHANAGMVLTIDVP